MNNKDLTMRDGAAELLEVILDKWWTWFGQPTAQRIKTSCSDDVPLTSIFCSPVPPLCIANNSGIQYTSAYACLWVPGIQLRGFSLCQQPCCLIQWKQSQHMPQRCPDHPSSPVKNALLELALLERAKHLKRKRKLRAVFISGAYEKTRPQCSQENPCKKFESSRWKPKVGNKKKRWLDKVSGRVMQSTHFSGNNINWILALILRQRNGQWESTVCSWRMNRSVSLRDSWEDFWWIKLDL